MACMASFVASMGLVVSQPPPYQLDEALHCWLASCTTGLAARTTGTPTSAKGLKGEVSAPVVSPELPCPMRDGGNEWAPAYKQTYETAQHQEAPPQSVTGANPQRDLNLVTHHSFLLKHDALLELSSKVLRRLADVSLKALVHAVVPT